MVSWVNAARRVRRGTLIVLRTVPICSRAPDPPQKIIDTEILSAHDDFKRKYFSPNRNYNGAIRERGTRSNGIARQSQKSWAWGRAALACLSGS